jgi:ribosomal protein S27AE
LKKELTSFYKHKAMADGHLNVCIECTKARVSAHREKNLDRIQSYDRERATRPGRIAKNKIYTQSEKGKIVRKKAQESYRNRYPMKYAAHVIFSNAVRDGNIVKQTVCSECGSNNQVHGHHDNYTKPLEVRWLCIKCHVAWHKVNKPIYE